MTEVRTIVGHAVFNTMREVLDFTTALVEMNGRKYKFNWRKVQDIVTKKVTYEVEWYKR